MSEYKKFISEEKARIEQLKKKLKELAEKIKLKQEKWKETPEREEVKEIKLEKKEESIEKIKSLESKGKMLKEKVETLSASLGNVSTHSIDIAQKEVVKLKTELEMARRERKELEEKIKDLSSSLDKGRTIEEVKIISSSISSLIREFKRYFRTDFGIAIESISMMEEKKDLDGIIKATKEAIEKMLESLTFVSQQYYFPEPKLALFPLQQLLVYTVDRFKSEITKNNIDVRFDVPNMDIETDRELFSELIGNIVENSIESMSNGGRLVVSAKKEMVRGAQMLVITIKDTGEGIPLHLLDKVFLPFFTTKKEMGKMGFGLTRAEMIAKMFSGFITIKSYVNEGTEVKVYLPHG